MLQEADFEMLLEWVKRNQPQHILQWAFNNPNLVVDFIEYTDEGGWNALHHASFRGHENIVACLLEFNADIESKDSVGQTPFLVAASRGAITAMRKLIEYGADVEAANNDGQTALVEGVQQGNLNIVEPLLEFCTNTNHVDRFKLNSVMWCAWYGMEFTPLIIDNGTDIEWATDEGWTALFFACKHRHTKIMRLLLERGADYLRTDIYGQYVMQLANTMDFDTKRVMEDYILRTVSISSESSYGSSMTSSREDDKRSLSLDLANEDTFMIMAPAVGVIVPTIKGAIQIPIPIVSASASTQPTVNSIVESVANEVERIKVEFEELGGYEDDIEDNTDSLSIGERSEGETVDGEDFDLQSSS